MIMTESEIYEKLTEIARDIFDDPKLELTPTTTADDVEEWDSMSHINLVVTIEATFGIKFKSAEIEELKNIGDLVEAIRRHLQG
jgi:acyl carrier protein